MKAKNIKHYIFKPAFTLVELIVVVAIIGILSGVLIAALSGSGDSANAARCLANMKNLASACQTYGMRESNYPAAGNYAMLSVGEATNGKLNKNYTKYPGWISMMDRGGGKASYSKASPISLYSNDEEEWLYALTNGALWKYVSGNRNTYVCPLHAKNGPRGMTPHWSYLMSAFFYWDSKGRAVIEDPRKAYGHLQQADKRLLFSEIPFSGHNTWQPEGEGGSDDTDAILQYQDAGGTEQLGVNHTKGREAFAHVAFADGHVEKLRVPVEKGKPDTSQMTELAEWLAKGYDCSCDKGKYRKLDD